MKKKLHLVINDNYTLANVTCFEKPQAIVLGNYNPIFRNYYYLFINIFKAYNINYKNLFDEINTSDIHIHNSNIVKWIAENKFNLKLHVKADSSDLINDIIELLNKDMIVLVAGNVRELFYSEHYKINNHRHLFIINGYDIEKEIFFIYDTQQLDNIHLNPEYFIMEFSTIKKVYQSFQQTYGSSYICGFENLDIDFKEIDFIREIMNILTSNIDDNLFKEPSLLKALDINNNIEYSNNSPDFLLTKISKYKEVIYNEIVFLLGRFYKDDANLLELTSMKDSILTALNNFINKILKKYYRKITLNYQDDLKTIIEMEKQFFKYLNSFKDKKNKNLTNIVFLPENNKDDIIKENDVDYDFLFTNNKTYNVWEDDNAPKLVLKNFKKNSDFTFGFKTTLAKRVEEACYHLGLIIKTDNNETYFLGLFCNNKIKIEKFYKNEKLFFITKELYEYQFKNDIKEINIIFERKDNKYLFLFETDKEKEIINIDDLKNIDLLSIGCKTWGDPLPIVFKVTNINYKSH